MVEQESKRTEEISCLLRIPLRCRQAPRPLSRNLRRIDERCVWGNQTNNPANKCCCAGVGLWSDLGFRRCTRHNAPRNNHVCVAFVIQIENTGVDTQVALSEGGAVVAPSALK